MKPEFYHVPLNSRGRLYIMPKPRGGDWLEDEIIGFKTYGIDSIVSLITSAEKFETGLAEEEAICKRNNIKFTDFPIKDRSVPQSVMKTKELILPLIQKLNDGCSVAVHCRFGVGRTGLIAAGILLGFGFSADEAFSYMSEIRKIKMPDTEEQKMWVIAHLSIIGKT